jgi:hypothetical protein
MLAKRKDITAKLIGIAEKKYQKIISNIQEKRIKKHKTQLQAELMLGSVRRVK